MVAPALVYAGISAFSGVSGYLTGRSNAKAARKIGKYNAQIARLNGRYTAESLLRTSALNAGLIDIQSGIVLTQIDEITDSNAKWARAIANYNYDKTQYEAQLVWEQFDLNSNQFRTRADAFIGNATAQYGASGVLLDAPGETPAQALDNIEVETQLDLMIMRHGADIQAGKLLDAAALSKWEGESQARQFEYEGAVQSHTVRSQSKVNRLVTLNQGRQEAADVLWHAELEANSLLAGGSYQAGQYRRKGAQDLFNGLAGGIGELAKGGII